MTREEWIKIYNAKDGTWDKDDLIDKAYEIITSPNSPQFFPVGKSIKSQFKKE